MKHTPTPYKVEEQGSLVYVLNEKGTLIVANVDGLTQEGARANAAFIVRACNLHKDMVEALDLALATIERLKPPTPHDSTQGTRDVIRAALAKAKGE